MKLERPSLGFSLVVLTYGLTVAFFAWGLSTPPLDRVWQLHHELKIGKIDDLDRADRELLLDAMARHPALAAALLDEGELGIISAHRDGWIDTNHVTVIRTPRSGHPARLLIDIQTPPQNMPYELEISGTGWERELDVKGHGSLIIDLPPAPSTPELITLELDGPRLRDDPSSLGVRVRFDPPGGAPPKGAASAATGGASTGEARDDDEEDGE